MSSIELLVDDARCIYCTAVTTNTDTYVNTRLFISIFGVVRKSGCYRSRRTIHGAGLRRSMTIDHQEKHKTLGYIYVMTVVGSRVCTTSKVCSLVPSPPETWFRGMNVGGSFRRV